MKKIIFTLCFAIVVSMCSCGENKPVTELTEKETEATTTTTTEFGLVSVDEDEIPDEDEYS